MFLNTSPCAPSLDEILVHPSPPHAEPPPPALVVWDILAPLQTGEGFPIQSLDEEQECPCFKVRPGGHLLVNLEMVNGQAASSTSLPGATWVDITRRPAYLHAFSACFLGLENCAPNGELELPVILALVEFKGLPVLLASRLEGVTAEKMSDCWVGMPVLPQFATINPLEPPDLYFVPV